MGVVEPEDIDVYIDIICPYAFQTSLWLRDLADQGIVDVRWRFFSLEEINRPDGKPHPWERPWAYGFSMMRVGALLARHDHRLWDQWYLAAGSALHVDGMKAHTPDVARTLLAEMGLDEALVDQAISDPTTADEVRADHESIVARGTFGVPTIVFSDDQALFGPVLIDPPSGSDAAALWDLVCGWRRFPHLYELKRPKEAEDLAAIAETFAPYLSARDWKTVQRPAP